MAFWKHIFDLDLKIALHSVAGLDLGFTIILYLSWRFWSALGYETVITLRVCFLGISENHTIHSLNNRASLPEISCL